MDDYKVNDLIGKELRVIVDRPIGSHHPDHPDLIYNLNYGYVPGMPAPDGEDIDAYIIGVDYAVTEFTGRVIAVIHRNNDIEAKLVVAPKHLSFISEEIISATDFVEQYFDITVITLTDKA